MKSRTDEPAEGHVVPFDSLEQEAFLNLWRTYDRLKALEESLFADYGLTAQQYNALRILRAKHPEPLPTLEIGARLVSRAPDITRLIDKLEDRRLVERRRDSANRRVVHVAITAAGLELLDELMAPLAQCHQSQLGHLSADELQRLIELLKLARLPHEGKPG
ncbi:MAG TPA: MarR family transcriptional regulator [Pirellulales bacterium]|nr:MarR family transcriptional regulator [Pirellulales bacterium]